MPDALPETDDPISSLLNTINDASGGFFGSARESSRDAAAQGFLEGTAIRSGRIAEQTGDPGPAADEHWRSVADELRQRFPGVDPAPLREDYQSLRTQKTNEGRLNYWTREADSPTTAEYLARRTPFVRAGFAMAESSEQRDAADRISRGEGTDRDFAVIGRARAEAGRQSRPIEGVADTLGRAADTLSYLPAMAGEFAAGGAVGKAVAGGVEGLLGAGIAGTTAGRLGIGAAELAGGTLGRPTEILGNQAERMRPEIAGGRGQDFWTALAGGTRDSAITTAAVAGGSAVRIPGIGPQSARATQLAALGIQSPAGMMVQGRIEEVAHAIVGDVEWERSGVVGDLLRGDVNQALRHLTVEAVAGLAGTGTHILAESTPELAGRARRWLNERGLPQDGSGPAIVSPVLRPSMTPEQVGQVVLETHRQNTEAMGRWLETAPVADIERWRNWWALDNQRPLIDRVLEIRQQDDGSIAGEAAVRTVAQQSADRVTQAIERHIDEARQQPKPPRTQPQAAPEAINQAREPGPSEGTDAGGGEFTTSRGSTYILHDDGTTTRTAANDPGHPTEAGEKTRSERTVYVDPRIAAALSTAGLVDAPRARVIIRDGKASLLTWNSKEGRWGIDPLGRDVPFSERPEIGKAPLELWQPRSDVPGFEAYAGMHAGTPITDVRRSGQPILEGREPLQQGQLFDIGQKVRDLPPRNTGQMERRIEREPAEYLGPQRQETQPRLFAPDRLIDINANIEADIERRRNGRNIPEPVADMQRQEATRGRATDLEGDPAEHPGAWRDQWSDPGHKWYLRAVDREASYLPWLDLNDPAFRDAPPLLVTRMGKWLEKGDQSGVADRLERLVPRLGSEKANGILDALTRQLGGEEKPVVAAIQARLQPATPETPRSIPEPAAEPMRTPEPQRGPLTRDEAEAMIPAEAAAELRASPRQIAVQRMGRVAQELRDAGYEVPTAPREKTSARQFAEYASMLGELAQRARTEGHTIHDLGTDAYYQSSLMFIDRMKRKGNIGKAEGDNWRGAQNAELERQIDELRRRASAGGASERAVERPIRSAEEAGISAADSRADAQRSEPGESNLQGLAQGGGAQGSALDVRGTQRFVNGAWVDVSDAWSPEPGDRYRVWMVGKGGLGEWVEQFPAGTVGPEPDTFKLFSRLSPEHRQRTIDGLRSLDREIAGWLQEADDLKRGNAERTNDRFGGPYEMPVPFAAPKIVQTRNGPVAVNRFQQFQKSLYFYAGKLHILAAETHFNRQEATPEARAAVVELSKVLPIISSLEQAGAFGSIDPRFDRFNRELSPEQRAVIAEMPKKDAALNDRLMNHVLEFLAKTHGADDPTVRKLTDPKDGGNVGWWILQLSRSPYTEIRDKIADVYHRMQDLHEPLDHPSLTRATGLAVDIPTQPYEERFFDKRFGQAANPMTPEEIADLRKKVGRNPLVSDAALAVQAHGINPEVTARHVKDIREQLRGDQGGAEGSEATTLHARKTAPENFAEPPTDGPAGQPLREGPGLPPGERVPGVYGLIEMMKRDTGIPVYPGRTARGVAMSYDTGTEAITANKMAMGDVSSAVHDIAHGLDQRFGILFGKMERATQPFTPPTWRGVPAEVISGFRQLNYDRDPAMPVAARVHEGFAEAFRMRILGIDLPPNATNEMRQARAWVDQQVAANPDLRAMVTKWEKAVARFQQGSGAQQFAGVLSTTGTTEAPEGQSRVDQTRQVIYGLQQKLYDAVVNELGPYERMEKAAEGRGYVFEPGTRPSELAMGQMFASRSWATRALEEGAWGFSRDEDGNVYRETIGKPLATILSGLDPVRDLRPIAPGRVGRFEEYFVARHLLDEASKGRTPVGAEQVEYARRAMEEFNQDPEFIQRAQGAASDLTEAFNDTLRILALDGTGLMTMDKVNQFIADKETYAPLIRILEPNWVQKIAGKVTGDAVDVGNRARVGSGYQIQSPLQVYLKRLGFVYSLLAKQNEWLAVRDLAEFKGMGDFMVKVDRPVSVVRANAEQLKRMLRSIGVDDSVVGDIIDSVGNDAVASMFTPLSTPKGVHPEIARITEGNIEFWRVGRQDLYELLTGKNNQPSGPVMQFVASPFYWSAKFLKFGATSVNHLFQAMNLPKDAMTFLQNSENVRGAADIPKFWAQAYGFTIRELFKREQSNTLFELYHEMGGEMHGAFRFDQKNVTRMYDEITGNEGLRGKFNVVRNVGEGILKILGAGEMGPRVVEMRSFLEKYLRESGETNWKDVEGVLKGRLEANPDRDPLPYHVLVGAMNAASEVTTPFGKLGFLTRQVNQFIPFFGPHVTDWAKTIRSTLTHPFRLAAMVAATSAIDYMLWGAHKDEQWYDEEPAYLRYNFWTTKIGDTILRFPKPRALVNMGAAFMQELFRQADNKNPRFGDAAQNALQQLLPGNMASGIQTLAGGDAKGLAQVVPLPPLFQAPLDVVANRSWSGQPIVPRRDEGLPPSQQLLTQGAYVADQLSGGIVSGNRWTRAQPFTVTTPPHQSVTDYYDRVQQLSGERQLHERQQQGSRNPRPFANEREYQTLQLLHPIFTAGSAATSQPTADQATRDAVRELEVNLSRAALGRGAGRNILSAARSTPQPVRDQVDAVVSHLSTLAQGDVPAVGHGRVGASEARDQWRAARFLLRAMGVGDEAAGDAMGRHAEAQAAGRIRQADLRAREAGGR